MVSHWGKRTLKNKLLVMQPINSHGLLWLSIDE